MLILRWVIHGCYEYSSNGDFVKCLFSQGCKDWWQLYKVTNIFIMSSLDVLLCAKCHPLSSKWRVPYMVSTPFPLLSCPRAAGPMSEDRIRSFSCSCSILRGNWLWGKSKCLGGTGKGSEERYELPRRALGRSPSRKRIMAKFRGILKQSEAVKWRIYDWKLTILFI